MQADAESGELQIYDDEEHLIEKIVIFDWVNSNEEENAFNKRVAASVKAVLTILSTKNIFDVPRFMKPLSVSLTDEDFVVIEELLFIDDDMLRLDDPLLKDLDADLDDFLANLLAALLFASNLRHQMQQNAKTKRFLSIKKAATCFVTA